eukprot:NODE_1159_length_1970_cov_0.708177.p3 type:complete len:158 gc:universal NODE_1159_length_1970_cov_0.708177:1280-807(-)
MSLAKDRLIAERKKFRKERPFGFSAVPEKTPNGELNMFKWICKIPGPSNSPWQAGLYTVELIFPNTYPKSPPAAIFNPPLLHPNIFTDGRVCLSLLKEHGDWKNSISLKAILLNLQDFLKNPNANDPANSEAVKLFKTNKKKYEERIRQQAARFRDM